MTLNEVLQDLHNRVPELHKRTAAVLIIELQRLLCNATRIQDFALILSMLTVIEHLLPESEWDEYSAVMVPLVKDAMSVFGATYD